MLHRRFDPSLVVSHQDQPGCQAGGSGAGDRIPQFCLVRLVQVVVAESFGVGLPELRAVTRGKAPVALARQVAMYLCHVALGLDYGRVALAFGRDRTTATHACRLVEDRRDDPDMDRLIEILERLFRDLREGRGCDSCKCL